MTNPVGPREIGDMARLMAIMNGQTPPANPDAAPGAERLQAQGPVAVGPPPAPGTADAASIDFMRGILSKFHGAADGAARSLVQESKRDPQLRESMMMAETPSGARFGEWEIEVRENGGRKFYDITRGDEKIASDLTLYEAALGIVRALNNGRYINSPDVRSILKDEEEYAHALHDAILFKRRLTEGVVDRNKREVHEARYGEAKRRAVAARDRIKARVADLDD